MTDKIITDFNEITEIKYLGVYKGKIYYKYYDVGREVKYPKVVDCSKIKSVFVNDKEIIFDCNANTYNFSKNKNKSDFSSSSYDVGLEIGYYFPINAIEFSIPIKNNEMIHQPLYGIHYWSVYDDNLGKYEDYTSTMGSVNTFGDRDDGLKYQSQVDSWGVMSKINIENSKNIILNWGLVNYKKKYYRALYDSYEILGNNGYYYIDTNKADESKNGAYLGLKYSIEYVDIYSIEYYWSLGFIFQTINEFSRMNFGFNIGMFF